mmetsp:Transcript_32315/g.62403  ORF Transcript_32315/g.62403 Transcript_32315/m.62403 type:complete len:110 (+) Transcript_32315:994-1323(+)
MISAMMENTPNVKPKRMSSRRFFIMEWGFPGTILGLKTAYVDATVMRMLVIQNHMLQISLDSGVSESGYPTELNNELLLINILLTRARQRVAFSPKNIQVENLQERGKS